MADVKISGIVKDVIIRGAVWTEYPTHFRLSLVDYLTMDPYDNFSKWAENYSVDTDSIANITAVLLSSFYGPDADNDWSYEFGRLNVYLMPNILRAFDHILSLLGRYSESELPNGYILRIGYEHLREQLNEGQYFLTFNREDKVFEIYLK